MAKDPLMPKHPGFPAGLLGTQWQFTIRRANSKVTPLTAWPRHRTMDKSVALADIEFVQALWRHFGTEPFQRGNLDGERLCRLFGREVLPAETGLRPGLLFRPAETQCKPGAEEFPASLRRLYGSRKAMIKKLLIANRGEIACRVIKTAKKMGIKTVAVYSDADRDALHVKMADEAVHIGRRRPTSPTSSIEKILEAIAKTGADAVHPGYGFLSESGPPSPMRLERMPASSSSVRTRAMRSTPWATRSTSKKARRRGQASPPFPAISALIADARGGGEASAGDIGYPVMIKASAGGGGKGMRIAWNDAEEAREGFHARPSNEAAELVRRRPRLRREVHRRSAGTSRSRCSATSTATCSISASANARSSAATRRSSRRPRRHSSTPKTRRAMGEQAVALAKAVGYDSAGTVEFVADQ